MKQQTIDAWPLASLSSTFWGLGNHRSFYHKVHWWSYVSLLIDGRSEMQYNFKHCMSETWKQFSTSWSFYSPSMNYYNKTRSIQSQHTEQGNSQEGNANSWGWEGRSAGGQTDWQWVKVETDKWRELRNSKEMKRETRLVKDVERKLRDWFMWKRKKIKYEKKKKKDQESSVGAGALTKVSLTAGIGIFFASLRSQTSNENKKVAPCRAKILAILRLPLTSCL